MQRTRRGTGILLALVVAAAAVGVAPIPVAACSCAPPEPLAAGTFVPSERAVFIGTVGPDDLRGARVLVERWFAGDGQAPVIWLDPGPFEPERLGGACGIPRPAEGSRWIMAPYRSEGQLGIHLCSTQYEVRSPEGQQLIAEARAAFGDGVPLGAGAPPLAPETILLQLLLSVVAEVLRLVFGG